VTVTAIAVVGPIVLAGDWDGLTAEETQAGLNPNIIIARLASQLELHQGRFVLIKASPRVYPKFLEKT
jgi:hypothetical protein